MQSYEPLKGLRIVELTSFVASPLAGLTLGQLGAEVIRIDPIGGSADYGRWPLADSGRSLYWAGLNKGKRSVTLDLRSARGRDLALALATLPGDGGGILVTNVAGREWLNHENLLARRSDLIDVRLLGYPDGRPALDYTVNAALGYPLVTGPPTTTDPVNHVLPAWDLLAGMHLALAVVVSERRRRLTGEGDQVTVSLWDTGLAATSHLGLLAEAEILQASRKRYGNYFYGGFGRDFTTADGRVMVVAPSGRQWHNLTAATVGASRMAMLAELLQADLDDEGVRFAHREAIAAVLAPWFAARDTATVVAVLEGAGVVCSAYRTFRDVVADAGPDWAGNDLLAEVDQPGVGRHRSARTVLHSRSHPRPQVRPAPALGEDTEDVLRELLGLSTADLQELRAAGVVASRPSSGRGEAG